MVPQFLFLEPHAKDCRSNSDVCSDVTLRCLQCTMDEHGFVCWMPKK